MKIASLFCGAGGLDLGLIQAGHQIVWANDHDPDAVATYRKNLGQHAVLGDIELIDTHDIPDCDAIVGGFPCQGFSLANMLRSDEDPRNKLYEYFLKAVNTKKPKYFLAENVRGILSLNNGKVIEKIKTDFEHSGYRIRVRLFNTADFGVPQCRWRVIISGTRSNLPALADYLFPEPTHSKNGDGGLSQWKSIGDALSEVPDPLKFPNDVPNQVFSNYKVTDRNFTGHRKTDPQKPSPTILARGNGGGGVCAIAHPNGERRLSARESAYIQTFPLTFDFFGKMNSVYRQIGNAVPVLFAYHLGIALKNAEHLLLTKTESKL